MILTSSHDFSIVLAIAQQLRGNTLNKAKNNV